ncbi:Uncharacterised protein [uncultured archaeon]|nr:Uncharacterised protein [uncultured archaeon]
MNREDILFLNQLIKSLGESGDMMEQSYKKGDYENFNKSKKIMLRIQKEISDAIK